MPTAYVHLPHHVEERRVAFINGFARMGFIVVQGQPTKPLGPKDSVVVWNRTARSNQSVEMARRGGGALIVCENGYHGTDRNGFKPYAMALDGHNGSGRWYQGDNSRLDKLKIDFKPFRAPEGLKVVIAGQRGIGSQMMRSPHRFEQQKAQELGRQGFHPYIRPHPGQSTSVTPLLEDLKDAHCLVVWSSNSATQALVEGIATYYAAPTIVTAGAAHPFRASLSKRFTDEDRLIGFRRMAWAQWFLDEISNSKALDTLLQVHAGRLPSCNVGLGL